MKNLLTAVLFFLALPCFAQTEIKIDDAKNHVGEEIKICTKIYGGKYFEKDSLTLLNAGAPYPESPLTIVIRGNANQQFKNPEVYYKGAEVCVTGKITVYHDKPQIEIFSKNQIMEQLKDHVDSEPK